MTVVSHAMLEQAAISLFLSASFGVDTFSQTENSETAPLPRIEYLGGGGGAELPYLCGAHVVNAILQLTVVTSVNKSSENNQISHSVAAHMSAYKSLEFGGITIGQISRAPEMAGAIREGGELRRPITIRLRGWSS